MSYSNIYKYKDDCYSAKKKFISSKKKFEESGKELLALVIKQIKNIYFTAINNIFIKEPSIKLRSSIYNEILELIKLISDIEYWKKIHFFEEIYTYIEKIIINIDKLFINIYIDLSKTKNIIICFIKPFFDSYKFKINNLNNYEKMNNLINCKFEILKKKQKKKIINSILINKVNDTESIYENIIKYI